MIKPKDLEEEFTEEDEDTLKSLEPKVDEQIRMDMQDSRRSEIDMYHPFRLENGHIIPERVWERLMQGYEREGWDVTRRGRVFVIQR